MAVIRLIDCVLGAVLSNSELSLKQNMLWNSAGSIVYLVCQWLITVLVVRLSDNLADAGTLALGMAVSNIFTPIGQYKIRAFQVSDITGEYSLSQYVGFRWVTLAISALIMVVYGTATCAPDTLPVVFAYGVYSMGPIFVDVLHGADQQHSRMDIIGKSYIMRGILSVSIFAVGLAVTHSLAATLCVMILATFGAILFYDLKQTESLCGSTVPDFDIRIIRKLFIVCAPAVIASFACSAIPSIPRQVLGEVLGQESLGVYASIASPVLIIQMGAQYIYAPLLVEFAKLSADGNRSGYYTLLLKVSVAMILVAVIGIIGFLLFGEPVLTFVYGGQVADHSYLLAPLCLCSALTAYIWFIADLLISVRDLRGNLYGYSISFVCEMVIMYPFIMFWGMNGATFSIILSYSLGIAFFLVRLLKRV